MFNYFHCSEHTAITLIAIFNWCWGSSQSFAYSTLNRFKAKRQTDAANVGFLYSESCTINMPLGQAWKKTQPCSNGLWRLTALELWTHRQGHVRTQIKCFAFSFSKITKLLNSIGRDRRDPSSEQGIVYIFCLTDT